MTRHSALHAAGLDNHHLLLQFLLTWPAPELAPSLLPPRRRAGWGEPSLPPSPSPPPGERCPRRAGAAVRVGGGAGGLQRPRGLPAGPLGRRPATHHLLPQEVKFRLQPGQGGGAAAAGGAGGRGGGGSGGASRQLLPAQRPRQALGHFEPQFLLDVAEVWRGAGLHGLPRRGPAVAAALSAAARALQGRGGAVIRGSAGAGGRAAQVTRRRHGDFPGQPASPPSPPFPGPPLPPGGKAQAGRRGRRRQTPAKPRGGGGRPPALFRLRDRDAPRQLPPPPPLPPTRPGHRDPSHRASRPAATLKPAGRWKRRGAALLP